MEQLVKEILSISKLEMNTINHMEFISLTDILKRVCEHLAPLATEKNMHVNNNISADIILMGNGLKIFALRYQRTGRNTIVHLSKRISRNIKPLNFNGFFNSCRKVII